VNQKNMFLVSYISFHSYEITSTDVLDILLFFISFCAWSMFAILIRCTVWIATVSLKFEILLYILEIFCFFAKSCEIYKIDLCIEEF